MAKTYLAEKEQLDAQNQTLTAISVDISEINVKIAPLNLENVIASILDFENDDITIISGGYDGISRIITT